MAREQLPYVERKIAHLRRVGLIAANSNGQGFHGGACPDWLRAEQEAQRKHRANNRKVEQALPAALTEAA